jgi:hypothetical protein
MKKHSYFILFATILVVNILLSNAFKLSENSLALGALLLILKIIIGFSAYAVFSLLGFVSLWIKYGSIQNAKKAIAENYGNNYLNLAQASLLNLHSSACYWFCLLGHVQNIGTKHQ